MMIFSLVAMTGLEKCCITSAYLQWLCHSGERPVAHGPLVSFMHSLILISAYFSPLISIRNNKGSGGGVGVCVCVGGGLRVG